MLNLGFSEIVLIFFAMVLFIHPEDIPKCVHTIRKWYRQLQRLHMGIQDELQLLDDYAEKEKNISDSHL